MHPYVVHLVTAREWFCPQLHVRAAHCTSELARNLSHVAYIRVTAQTVTVSGHCSVTGVVVVTARIPSGGQRTPGSQPQPRARSHLHRVRQIIAVV
jgi:hypothetical protein